MNLNSVVSGAKKSTNPILSGLTYTFAIVIASVLVFALLLYFTNISDVKLPYISYFVTVLSVLIGGFISGKRAGARGWYYGGITGVIYGILVIIITFLSTDTDVNLRSILLILLTFLFGSFGGIMGVNTKK